MPSSVVEYVQLEYARQTVYKILVPVWELSGCVLCLMDKTSSPTFEEEVSAISCWFPYKYIIVLSVFQMES